MNETREKILDTAERLIGEQGYAATSLRHIIAEAGVNLAAVHYHFGSKEELLDAVVQRRAATVNGLRLARLDALERSAGEAPLEVVAILEAFFEPTVEISNAYPQFVRLMGRVYSEGMVPAIGVKHFQPTAQRFLEAAHRALPELPLDELKWRAEFMVGAMAQTMCSAPRQPALAASVPDIGRRMKMLVTFLVAGFRAPATQSEER
jgi:AcrR family transcriptional regulator